MSAEPLPTTAVVRTLRRFETVVRWLSRAALAVSALILFAIFVLISYSVVLRYLWHLPQPWIDEAIGWLLVGSVMLAVPEVQRRGDHIGIDFVLMKLGSRARHGLLILSVIFVLASAVLFVREGLAMVQFSRLLNVLSNQLPEVPLWLIQGFVPVGFALMALVALVQLLCLLAGLKPRDMSEQLKEEI